MNIHDEGFLYAVLLDYLRQNNSSNKLPSESISIDGFGFI